MVTSNKDLSRKVVKMVRGLTYFKVSKGGVGTGYFTDTSVKHQKHHLCST